MLISVDIKVVETIQPKGLILTWCVLVFFMFSIFAVPQLMSEKYVEKKKLMEERGWLIFIEELGLHKGRVPTNETRFRVAYPGIGRTFWMPKSRPDALNVYLIDDLICDIFTMPVSADELKVIRQRHSAPLVAWQRLAQQDPDVRPDRFMCAKNGGLLTSAYKVLGLATVSEHDLGRLLHSPPDRPPELVVVNINRIGWAIRDYVP